VEIDDMAGFPRKLPKKQARHAASRGRGTAFNGKAQRRIGRAGRAGKAAILATLSRTVNAPSST